MGTERVMACGLLLAVAACTGGEPEETVGLSWDAMADTTQRVAVITGFDGPESVLYDPDQDVWFVSVFNGPSGDRDANGYVSRVRAGDGTVESLLFAQGTEAHPFHAGRGMALQGDTLWVADAQGVHGFHRRTGEQLVFVNMRLLRPQFINDLAVGGDGTLYATDTGKSALYRVHPGEPAVALESEALGDPNGILWDSGRGAFWIAPWSGGSQLRLWDPATGEVTLSWVTEPAGRMDGAVLWGRHLLVASQADSAIHAVSDTRSGPYIRTQGRPADLGLDTQRGRVAIPEVALNQVEIWQLPGAGGR